MSVLMMSATITAAESEDSSGTDKTDWLNITQNKIDPRFDTVTSDFLSTLFATVANGGDPYSLLTYDCPATRRIISDGVVTSYAAEVIVNRSSSLEGNYTLSAGQYKVTGPRKSVMKKSGSLITDGRKVIELGWLPLSLSIIQEYPLFPVADWTQENGFLYLSFAEYYAFFVIGIAEVDIWTVHIDHQQGESFLNSEISVVAKWGRDNRVDEEIKIPGCVIDSFNECPKNSFGVGGQDPDQKKWNDIQLNPCSPRRAWKDGCTGNIIRYDEMEDER